MANKTNAYHVLTVTYTRKTEKKYKKESSARQ